MTINGWQISTHPEDDRYIYLTRDGAPGNIPIKADAEGFVVDMYSDDSTPESVSTTYALYTELGPE